MNKGLLHKDFMNKGLLHKDFVNNLLHKDTLRELIAILTPLSDSNNRKNNKESIRGLQKVGAYQECKELFMELKGYKAEIRNNIVTIKLDSYNRQYIESYFMVRYGGKIDNDIYTVNYNPYLIFSLAMQGYIIKGLGRKKPPLHEKLTTPYSKYLSSDQRAFIESYKSQGRLLMSHTMGKGKTPSAIIACKERKAKRILLTTTKSTIPNWIEEFHRFGLLTQEKDNTLTISVIHKGVRFLKDKNSKAVTTYSNKKTLFGQWAKQDNNANNIDNDIDKLRKSDVIIVTHAAMLEGTKLHQFLQKHDIIIDTLIIDEAHLVANSVTKRGIKLREITQDIKDVLMLTGTPINKISLQEIDFYFDMLYPNLISHWDLHKMFLMREQGKQVFKNIHSLHRLIKLIAPHRLIWQERLVGEKGMEELGLGKLIINTVTCEASEDLKSRIKEIEEGDYNPLVKSIHKTLAYAPTKKEKAIEIIERELKTRDKIVVFSAFNDVLHELLDKYQNKAILITGKTNNRGVLINKFKNDPNCKIFLGNIKAAGIGINLQNASYSIILEPGYESEKVQQAIKRTHRRGNTSPEVIVDLIMIEGETLEKNKENIINKKAYASSMIMDYKGDRVMGELNKNGVLDDSVAQERKIELQAKAQRQEAHRNEYDRQHLASDEKRQGIIEARDSTTFHHKKLNYMKNQLESVKTYCWYVPSWRNGL